MQRARLAAAATAKHARQLSLCLVPPSPPRLSLSCPVGRPSFRTQRRPATPVPSPSRALFEERAACLACPLVAAVAP